MLHMPCGYVYLLQTTQTRFQFLHLRDNRAVGRRRLAMFHISWSSTAMVFLQSLPCENDKLKWYMCGLTCTAQKSLGWITLYSVCVYWTYLLSWGGVGALGSAGPLGRHYRPPIYPHGLLLPVSLQEGLECHLLLWASHYISSVSVVLSFFVSIDHLQYDYELLLFFLTSFFNTHNTSCIVLLYQILQD